MAEYTCRYCGEEFGTSEEYQRHRLVAHPAGGSDLLTGDFGGVTDIRDIDDASEVNDAGTVVDTGRVRGLEASDRALSSSGRSEPPAFRCSSCGQEFDNQEELIEHIDTAHRRDELTA